MAFESTRDLKQLALNHAGELSDGTSGYDADAVRYINSAYAGVLAGGSEFGIDTSDSWSWAKAKNPIIIDLQPAYDSGTVTLTNGSLNGVYSVAPTLSHKDWFLKLESVDDYMRIRTHNANGTSFQLDRPFTGSTGSYNFRSIKLDYELSDDYIVVDDLNNKLDFVESGSSVLTASLTHGVYSASNFASHLQTQLNAVGSVTYLVTFNSITRKFNIAQGGVSFSMMFSSGPNSFSSCDALMGYEKRDYTGALSYDSAIPLNAIQRLIAPFTMYQNRNSYLTSPKDSGKIFGTDYNTMLMQYPISQMNELVPEKFCKVQERSNGIVTVRFSSYPHEAMRVEIEHIPKVTQLQDNNSSIPSIPQSFREYLVYASCYYICLDKNDSNADKFGALAKAKLEALKNDERAQVAKSANNYARVIPRQQYSNNKRYYRL